MTPKERMRDWRMMRGALNARKQATYNNRVIDHQNMLTTRRFPRTRACSRTAGAEATERETSQSTTSEVQPEPVPQDRISFEWKGQRTVP